MNNVPNLTRIAAFLNAIALLGCSGASPSARPDPRDADPDSVARSLVDVARTICIPYAVDGTHIEALVHRNDVTKWVGDVHGEQVTRYFITAPGAPIVTPTDASCLITTSRTPLDTAFVTQVYRKFRSTLIIKEYKTKPPPETDPQLNIQGVYPPFALGVVCVLGENPALIVTSNPQGRTAEPLPTDPRDHAHIDVEVLFHEEGDGCR